MSDAPNIPEGYTVQRLLGSGGTARVYLANRTDNNRTVAVKIPLYTKKTDNSEFLELIRREQVLIGKLGYPGLVRVLDLHDERSHDPALVLEYCSGITLDRAERIEDIGALMNVISSISISLFYLKLAGIAHGDLKPQNIFLTAPPAFYAQSARRYSKLSDFSLAFKTDAADDNRLGFGTMGYIAPETIDRGILTHQSDIFALGIIAYILGTGKHPFIHGDPDPVRVNALIKEHEPPAPIEINGNLPESLSRLIQVMLSKAPEGRPRDGWAVCERLEEFGAIFPFRRMIRPGDIIELHPNRSTEEILRGTPFELNEPTINAMLDYVGNDQCRLRMLLDCNFTGRTIQWREGRLTTGGDCRDIRWPRRMQRWEWNIFRRLSYTEKRTAILVSLLKNAADAGTLGITGANAPHLSRPVLTCLNRSISKSTRRRFAKHLGDRAINIKNHRLAAELYLDAENLDSGFTATLDAVAEMNNTNRYTAARNLLTRLERLCRSHDDIAKLRLVYRHQAAVAKMTGESTGAEKIYLKIINLYKGDCRDRLLAEVYKELGDLYRIKQEYDAGIDALQKAEDIFSELGDQLELSHILNNIGNLCWISSQYDRALTNYRQALRIQRELKATGDIAITLSNIASILFLQERYDRAVRLLELSLRLQRETGNDPEIARTLNNLGYVQYELGKFDLALEFLNESTELNRTIGNKKELLYNLENLTQVMLSAGRLRQSIKHLKEGMRLSEELSDRPHLGAFSRGMGKVFRRLGYYGQAYKSLMDAAEISMEIKDDRERLESLIQLADLYDRLNLPEDAAKTCREILALAGKIDNKRATIFANMTLGHLTADIDHISKAVQAAEQIKNRRDQHLSLLMKAEILLARQDYERAAFTLNVLAEVFYEAKSDIANAGYFLLRGIYCGAVGKNDEARDFFEKALRVSAATGLLPEMTDASYHLGKLLTESGEYESGYGYFRDAINAAKKIAEDIKDGEMKAAFLSQEKIASMAVEVKRLSAVLAQKK
ncbi:MAG: tetratricopeptide repeat protein [Candidatus Zixiibacteriota bacterium]|nr:MAG: tetratricopeptide repeat protein [candidate division Zixibacteria bacterium]